MLKPVFAIINLARNKFQRSQRFGGISALFDLEDIYYNYIDKQKLSGEKRWRTPAERAKIKLELGNKFQLLNLIQQSYAKIKQYPM